MAVLRTQIKRLLIFGGVTDWDYRIIENNLFFGWKFVRLNSGKGHEKITMCPAGKYQLYFKKVLGYERL